MLLRDSSGLTEALPGLNLVGAWGTLLTNYSRFHLPSCFFVVCFVGLVFFLLMQHFSIPHMLKNSEEQFIHSNVSQRIVTLHNKKHYESKKKNFMNL